MLIIKCDILWLRLLFIVVMVVPYILVMIDTLEDVLKRLK